MSEVQSVGSVLNLKRSFFDECVYIRRSDDVERAKFEINFNREISCIDANNYRVSLRCNAKDETGMIEMHVRIVGMFYVDSSDENKKKELISKNTMAILFPYLRSQVTLLTAQIDGPKFTLPVMNIAGMFPSVDLPKAKTE